jgi:hypothetical protein
VLWVRLSPLSLAYSIPPYKRSPDKGRDLLSAILGRRQPVGFVRESYHKGWNPVSDMSAPRPAPIAYRGVYSTSNCMTDVTALTNWAQVQQKSRRTHCGCALSHGKDHGRDVQMNWDVAGGCFWGLQLAFDRVPGVKISTVGYTGGKDPNPNYNSVCSGRTGHAEAVQVITSLLFPPSLPTYNNT